MPAHRDEYIAKMGLADELARGSWKKAKQFGSHRTPLQILDAVDKGAGARDVDLWKEYAAAFRGHRQLTYNKGLRERYDLREEQTELGIIAELDNQPAELLGTIDSETWDEKLRGNPRMRLWLLKTCEDLGAGGFEQAMQLLRGPPPAPTIAKKQPRSRERWSYSAG